MGHTARREEGKGGMGKRLDLWILRWAADGRGGVCLQARYFVSVDLSIRESDFCIGLVIELLANMQLIHLSLSGAANSIFAQNSNVGPRRSAKEA